MKHILITMVLALASTLWADENEQVRGWFLEIDGDTTTQTKDGLNEEQRQELFSYVVKHKVAAITPENTKKYDPTGEVGYCYGRAMAVHLRARRMGLKPGSIKRLFIIGDLRQGPKPEWRFHTTTVVQGTDKTWYAVDPILIGGEFKGTPLPMIEWIRTVRSVWDKKDDPRLLAKLYLVDPWTIMPDVRVYPDSAKEETGEIITDLSFNPAGRKGFRRVKVEEETVLRMSEVAQEKYFLRAKESVDADQFDFSSLRITIIKKTDMGVKKIPASWEYHGYFNDLVDDLKKAPYPERNEERRLVVVPVGASGSGGTGPQGTEIHRTEIHKGGYKMYSPRIGRAPNRR